MTNLSDEIQSLVDSGDFDAEWYRSRYPDVDRLQMSPGEHFVRIGRRLGRPGKERLSVSANLKVGARNYTYASYVQKIMGKIDEISKIPKLSANVDIQVDYTGPEHLTPFDSFLSNYQRDVTEKQIRRMLELGVTALNPQPGIHAARLPDGNFMRYASIRSETSSITSVPEHMIIHIHAFYPDVVKEMLEYFCDDAKHARFYITVTTASNEEKVQEIIDDLAFDRCEIELVKNSGRDIGPFLDHAVGKLSDGDVICHIHTKKSPDVGDDYGIKWRRSLYGALLTQTAIDAFEDPDLGLLFPDTPQCVGWGKNRALCETIGQNLGVELADHPGPFPIGNMFYAKAEVARAMREVTQGLQWPREPVAYDGTILHAIERMWPAVCGAAGFEWAAIHSAYDVDVRGG